MTKWFNIGEYFIGDTPMKTKDFDDLIVEVSGRFLDAREDKVRLSKVTNMNHYIQGSLSASELKDILMSTVYRGKAILVAYKDRLYKEFNVLTQSKLDVDNVEIISKGLLTFMLNGVVTKLTLVEYETVNIELDALRKNNIHDYLGKDFDLGTILNFNYLTEIPHHDKELELFGSRELLGHQSTLMLFAHTIKRGERVKCSALIHKEQLESAEIALYHGFELHIHTDTNSFWVRDVEELPSLNKKEVYYINAVKEVGNSTLPFELVSRLTKYAKEEEEYLKHKLDELFNREGDHQDDDTHSISTDPLE